MNFVSWVLGILLLLSLSTARSFQQKVYQRNLETSLSGHLRAQRKMLSSMEKGAYRASVGKQTYIPPKKEDTTTPPKPAPAPPRNPSCARLALWPLLAEGKNQHPLLYQKALHFLSFFYEGHIEGATKETLSLLLNHILTQKLHQPLETITFSDPSLQFLYYKLLKGEKQGHALPLLDLITLEEKAPPLCLCHAHPSVLSALLSPKMGDPLFQALHPKENQKKPREIIESMAQHYQVPLAADFWQICNVSHATTPDIQQTLLVTDSKSSVTLRKNTYPQLCTFFDESSMNF